MNVRPRIISDAAIPFLEGVLEPYADMVYLPGQDISSETAREADALLIRTRTRCDAALLEGSRVKLIATATIGYDHIDLPYCAGHGIEVATAAGCNARGVLQYVMGALAALSETDGWRPDDRTLGVVGVGHVGSLVADQARRLGFRVLCCDPPRMETDPALGFLPLGELLPRCDIVTMHVPLTRSGTHRTLGMADSAFFDRIGCGAENDTNNGNDAPPLTNTAHPLIAGGDHSRIKMADSGASASGNCCGSSVNRNGNTPNQSPPSPNSGVIFINSSRGEVMDDDALLDALRSGRVARACIDTWNHEPEIDRRLLESVTFATPHIAGYSIQGKAAGTAAVVRAVARVFGLPLAGWYPPQVTPATPNPGIGWEELTRTIKNYFDIRKESNALKTKPEEFEAMRDHYDFRTEYF